LICVKSSIGLDNAGVPLNKIHRRHFTARESAALVLADFSLFKLWLSSLKKLRKINEILGNFNRYVIGSLIVFKLKIYKYNYAEIHFQKHIFVLGHYVI